MRDFPIESTVAASPKTPRSKEVSSALSEAPGLEEDGPVAADEAEFLAGLRASVEQANAGQVTPIRPILKKLRAKYGDGE